jgi:FdrA protein
VSGSVEVRPGVYHDSVTLLQVSRRLRDVPGVRAAQVAMGTPLNLEVLAGMGLAAPPGTGPDDLVLGLDVEDDASRERALAALVEALAPRRDPGGSADAATAQPPLTTGSAVRGRPGGLVVVSVPGESAFAEARDAVDAGWSVVVFSDNVPLDQEVALKDLAAERDVLVMGPDCGTAVVGGLGVGFANAVRPGPVSLVAASGTGAQQVMALLDTAGVGVRCCLGLGGRDLSAAVGGRSASQALRALAADPGTELAVLVSKPPDDEVARRLRAEAAELGLPVVEALLGPGSPDLTAAVEHVLRRLGRDVPTWPRWPAAGPDAAADPGAAGLGPSGRGAPLRRGAALRGLFCGGTLCEEAMLIASADLGPVRSNVPLRPDWLLAVDGSGRWDAGDASAMVDFGDDALTRGRAHPMIDPTLRDARLVAEARDPRVGVLLMDVVLGHGAHPDPASELAPRIRDARALAAADGGDLAVVVTLVGTAGDPQGRDAQAAALATAGADVLASNAEAARYAVRLVRASPEASS